MANIDRPNGLKVRKTINGSPVSAMMRKLSVAARSDATNNHGDIYIGDPIAVSVGGVVTVANSGDTIYGVVAGVGIDNVDHGNGGMYKADDLETRYIPHDAAGYVWVHPKENNLFEVQSASDLDLTVGAPADITNAAATAHGSRTTGVSSCELTTNANSDITVVEIVTTPDNDSTLANTRYLVKIA
jgi:hypothetical protein